MTSDLVLRTRSSVMLDLASARGLWPLALTRLIEARDRSGLAKARSDLWPDQTRPSRHAAESQITSI